MIPVEFEPGEIVTLRNLLHLVVKAEGMKVAEVCIHFDKKLLDAAKAFEAKEPGNGSEAS